MLDILRQDLRLVLLQLLSKIDGYTANDSVLLAGAGTLGHMGVSRSPSAGSPPRLRSASWPRWSTPRSPRTWF